MARSDLLRLRKETEEQYIRQSKLGGYSTDAETIAYLLHCILVLTNQMLEFQSEPKKKK